MTPALALAAAQTVPVRGDVTANVEEHLRLARAAAAEGARVLLFPELSLTGYELTLADELAFSERDVDERGAGVAVAIEEPGGWRIQAVRL